jgi:carboxymethylenebutenolidase
MRTVLALTSVFLCAGCAAHVPGPSRPVDESVEYRSGKDTVRGLLCRPAGEGPFPALVVVHGDFGLNDAIKGQARRLADRGYLALAVDLYRGEAPGDVTDAHILSRGLPEERVRADLKGATDSLTARPDVRRDAVGIIGWDTGGGYALDAACADSRLRAVVNCGGRLTTDPDLLAPLQAPVLGIFAGKDAGFSPETVRQFEAAMTKAGKGVAGVHVYDECGPEFLDPASPDGAGKAAADARADAWKHIETYLAGELKR